MLEKLNKILESSKIPEAIRKMIDNLDEDGKTALNDFYDENSDFNRHAKPDLIAHRFYPDEKGVTDLYHYTTVDSLKKIVFSKTFYFGSIHSMNDKKEVDYTYELGKKELENLGANSTEINEFFASRKKLPWDQYIWSFSANKNSMALQNYGEIALSFNRQKIQENLSKRFSIGANSFSDFDVGNGFVFPLKVEYNKENQLEYINPVAREWLYAYRNLNKDPYDMLEIMKHSMGALFLFSLCFKNPCLYQEEEIRFVVLKINDNNDINPEKVINNRPFISCDFNPELLRSIVLSHKAYTRENSIRKILDQSGFSTTKIEHTQLPY